MEKVIVFGNGQGAGLNYMTLTHDSPYQVSAFTVDRNYIGADTFLGLPVVPFENVEERYPPSEYKMSIYLSFRRLNRVRAEKYDQAKAKGFQLISYVSSKAFTYPDLIIGDNSFIFEHASVGPFATIGNNVVIANGSMVGHNSVIKDHSFISPHAVVLGSTTVEPYCLIGPNAVIKDGGVVIAAECVIGAGTWISQSTRARGVYTGNPAKLSSESSNELVEHKLI